MDDTDDEFCKNLRQQRPDLLAKLGVSKENKEVQDSVVLPYDQMKDKLDRHDLVRCSDVSTKAVWGFLVQMLSWKEVILSRDYDQKKLSRHWDDLTRLSVHICNGKANFDHVHGACKMVMHLENENKHKIKNTIEAQIAALLIAECPTVANDGIIGPPLTSDVLTCAVCARAFDTTLKFSKHLCIF